MRKLLSLITAVVLFVVIASATSPKVDAVVRVHGYTRSNGTYVQPYYRTNPNSYKYDNYSYHGNYNPYSGKYGTRY